MPTEPNVTKNKSNNAGEAVAYVRQLAKTIAALVFIINSVALGLFALDLVDPSQSAANLFGAISFAFAAVVLGTFVHDGVKYQSTSKRKR